MTPSSAKKNKESSHLSGFGFKKAGEERDPEQPVAEEKRMKPKKKTTQKTEKWFGRLKNDLLMKV